MNNPDEKKKSPILKILGIGCLVIILLGSVGGYLLYQAGVEKWEESKTEYMTQACPALINEHVQSETQKAEILGKLAEIETLGINMFALGRIQQTIDGSKAGGIDEAEGLSLIEVLDMIISKGGSLSISDISEG